MVLSNGKGSVELKESAKKMQPDLISFLSILIVDFEEEV
jgi:hypothetical protein